MLRTPRSISGLLSVLGCGGGGGVSTAAVATSACGNCRPVALPFQAAFARKKSRHEILTTSSTMPTRRCMSTVHNVLISEGREVAYQQMPGTRQPTVVFVPGLHSYAHMKGMTAKSIMRYCDLHDYNCIVYDAEGMGASTSLADRKALVFSHWVEDVISVVERLTEGPVVLVSCSMGAWLALVAAQRLKDKVHGMVLWAPAINYAYSYYKKHWELLPKEVQHRLDKGEVHILSHHYGDALLKQDFAQDSLRFQIDVTQPFQLDCPVRLLHGLQDQEVDPEQSKELAKAITSPDVDLIFRKSGQHQLESPQDIQLFLNTLDRLLKNFPVN